MSNADREERPTLRAVPSVSEPPRRFPHTLPITTRPLIGRRRELQQAADVLFGCDRRLLTLTGTGGVGKSRLAVEVAVRSAPQFGDSVLYVPLAGIFDPALVLPTVLRAAKAQQDDRDPVDAAVELFGGDDALLVLDNFEHLLDAARQLGELHARCRRLRLLVTSRRALRLSDEHELVVGPLDVPDRSVQSLRALEANHSVMLLLQTVRRFEPDFELNPDTVDPIAAICRRLDGLPLAIELAAARLRVLSRRDGRAARVPARSAARWKPGRTSSPARPA